MPAPAVGARKLPAGADPMTTGVPTLTADARRAVGLGYLKTKFHVVGFVMTSERVSVFGMHEHTDLVET